MNDTTSEQFKNDFQQLLENSCIPARLSAHYQLVSCLKHTSETDVYLLKDNSNARFILKCGTGSHIALLKQEADIYTRLHQNSSISIPQFFHCFMEGDICCLLREYIEGITLSEYSEKQTAPSEGKILLMINACKIIETLHNQNPPIIHRDIKADNFVIQKDSGTLYLIDFDSTHLYFPGKERDTRFLGTLSHAAPEQFGFSQSDVRTDIYGLGITFLYLLTGSTDKKTLQNEFYAPELLKIIEKAVAFDPKSRYSSVFQMRKRLQAVQKKRTRQKTYYHSVFLMLFFISLGFAVGFHLQDAQSSSEQADEKATDAQPHTQSLSEQAGAGECNLSIYQDYLDTIILAAYDNDDKTFAVTCRELITALYNNKELTRMEMPDCYYTDVPQEDFYECSPIDRICYRMACRNRILLKKSDEYEQYGKRLLSDVRNTLYPTFDMDNCLYQYAIQPADTKNNYYGFALSDLLECLIGSWNNIDNVETPY